MRSLSSSPRPDAEFRQNLSLIESEETFLVFPDLFSCSVCSRALETQDERFLAPGLQAVVCGSCDHRNASGMLIDVIELARDILKRPLNGDAGTLTSALLRLETSATGWQRYYTQSRGVRTCDEE